MFYVPITQPCQQLYTPIHGDTEWQGQQQITIPEFSSLEVLQILPPPTLVEASLPLGSHPWWLVAPFFVLKYSHFYGIFG